MEEIDEKKLVEQVRAEFDRKLKAWDFVQSVKQAVENKEWTKYGDCPLIDKISINQIKACYERIKNGEQFSKCSIWNSERGSCGKCFRTMGSSSRRSARLGGQYLRGEQRK